MRMFAVPLNAWSVQPNNRQALQYASLRTHGLIDVHSQTYRHFVYRNVNSRAFYVINLILFSRHQSTSSPSSLPIPPYLWSPIHQGLILKSSLPFSSHLISSHFLSFTYPHSFLYFYFYMQTSSSATRIERDPSSVPSPAIWLTSTLRRERDTHSSETASSSWTLSTLK